MKKSYSRDQLSHVRADSMPFLEATLNAVVDGTRQRGWPATRRGRMDQFGEQQRPGIPRHPVVVGQRFQNGSGATVPPFGVVIVETGDLYVNDASSPDATVVAVQPGVYGSQYQAFVNGLDPVEPGDFGYCRRQEKMLAAYDPSDGTPVAGTMLGPRAGTFLLKKNTGGFRCVGQPTNVPSGLNLTWVEPLPMLTLRGKTTGTISSNSADTHGITIFWGSVNTGLTLTGAYNDSPTQIPSNTTVILTYSPDVVDGSLGSVPWRVTPWGTQMVKTTASGTVLAGSSGLFAPVGGGASITATVLAGLAINGSTYLVALASDGNYYVEDPSLEVEAQFATGTATNAGSSALVTLYAGGGSLGVNVTATVREGVAIGPPGTGPNRQYRLVWATAGWEVMDADLICRAAFPAVGSTLAFAGGTFASALIYTGTLGNEASTGTSVSAFIPAGVCIASGPSQDPYGPNLEGSVYTLGYTPAGWEVLDPETCFIARLVATTPAVGATRTTFLVYTGTSDSEVNTNLTITVNIRYGVCFGTGQNYRITYCNGREEFEVEDPDVFVYGQVTADIAADATGTLTLYNNNPPGSTTTVTVTARNDSSCVVKAGKITWAHYARAAGCWVCSVFHSQ